MKEETTNWLDYCQKGRETIDELIAIVLAEHSCSVNINKEDLEKRCQVKFEVYSHPVYTEYQVALDTLVQVLRITGVDLK